MSTLSSISTSQPVSLECSTYSPNTEQFIMCIGSMNAAKDACVVSNLFDSENKSHEQLAHLLHRLYDQRAKLTEFYNREIEICEVTEKLIRFLDQIDVVLDQYEQDSSSLDSLNIIVGSNQSIDEENYAEYLRDMGDSTDLDVNDLLADHNVEPTADQTEDENAEKEPTTSEYTDHSYSRSSQSDLSTQKKFTINQLKRFKYKGCCPLTSRKYGLDPVKHGIRHFPCTRMTAPINLYKHLIQYHHLTHSPAMQIVRLIADENEEGDIDLFSNQFTSLIATNPTIYRAQCPLNEYGKFGITAEHKVRLCTQPNQTIGAPLASPKDVCLYDHFVVYHQMKRSCAQRLAEAILRNKTDPIFRPDENILNETFYVQCPLRHPQAICWSTPISSRHMGQHLTGIHKLDRNQRRQIMQSLRKPS